MANFNVLRREELEKSLGKTVYSSFKKVMDNYILENLKNEGSFSIPIVQVLVAESPQLKKKLLELYDRKMATVDTSHISEEIKILQASAFDGLLLGYNYEKNMQMAIYTANPNAIFHFDEGSKFSLDRTLEFNEQGIVHAVRVDIEYTSEEGFMFKPVSLNKNTNLKVLDLATMDGRFLLVPYLAVQRSMAFFKEMLDDGRMLRVTQNKDDLVKVRNISAKGSDLAKYSDNPEFSKSLKPEYFPLKGYFYAPVLGANSLTLGKTRIELVDVCKVESISNPKIDKAQGIDYYIREKAMARILSEMYTYDLEAYDDIIRQMPNKGHMLDTDCCPSPMVVISYFRQLGVSDKDKVLALIPGLQESESSVSKFIKGYENIDVDSLTVDSLRDMLKYGVYKILIRKKNCEYSTMIVTNDTSVLSSIYGVDYFGNYESFGVRLYKLEDLVTNKSVNVTEAMGYCGLGDRVDLSGRVMEVLSTNDLKLSKHERLAVLLGEEDNGTTKKVVKREPDNSQVLCRECFAEYGVASSYYKTIDINKIVSIARLG